jgi:hypothetical protein
MSLARLIVLYILKLHIPTQSASNLVYILFLLKVMKEALTVMDLVVHFSRFGVDHEGDLIPLH